MDANQPRIEMNPPEFRPKTFRYLVEFKYLGLKKLESKKSTLIRSKDLNTHAYSHLLYFLCVL